MKKSLFVVLIIGITFLLSVSFAQDFTLPPEKPKKDTQKFPEGHERAYPKQAEDIAYNRIQTDPTYSNFDFMKD